MLPLIPFICSNNQCPQHSNPLHHSLYLAVSQYVNKFATVAKNLASWLTRGLNGQKTGQGCLSCGIIILLNNPARWGDNWRVDHQKTGSIRVVFVQQGLHGAPLSANIWLTDLSRGHGFMFRNNCRVNLLMVGFWLRDYKGSGCDELEFHSRCMIVYYLCIYYVRNQVTCILTFICLLICNIKCLYCNVILLTAKKLDTH